MIDGDKFEMNNEIIDLSILNRVKKDELVADSYEDLDPEEYGEPPPSYKLAKYYPKATLELDSQTESSTMISSTQLFSIIEPLLFDQSGSIRNPGASRSGNSRQLQDENARTSNIYENIEETTSHNSSEPHTASSYRNNNNNNNANARRAKFQGLKKHTHRAKPAESSSSNSNERTTPPDPNQPNLLMFSSTSSSPSNSTHSSQILPQERPKKNVKKDKQAVVSHVLVETKKLPNVKNNSTSNEQFL
jgi:hypothetical protein